MQSILIRSGCYISIIILGFVLRRIGFFKESDFAVLAKIVVRITLPAVLVVNAATRQLDPRLLVLTLLGFGSSLLYVGIGWLLGRSKGKDAQAFSMLNISGYNIGVFIIPFTEAFLGATGIMAAGIFDVGNAFICLGGSYSIAAAVKNGTGLDVKRVFRTMATSVPLLAHIITFAINLMHITIPSVIVDFAGIIANANAFLAMLMIGVGFRLQLDRSQIGLIVRILLARFGMAIPLALAYWYLLPFDRIVRLALMIITVAPLASAAPGFTEEIGCDSGLACTVSSLMVLISIALVVTLLICLL